MPPFAGQKKGGFYRPRQRLTDVILRTMPCGAFYKLSIKGRLFNKKCKAPGSANAAPGALQRFGAKMPLGSVEENKNHRIKKLSKASLASSHSKKVRIKASLREVYVSV